VICQTTNANEFQSLSICSGMMVKILKFEKGIVHFTK
jgi:hypothetical protein